MAFSTLWSVMPCSRTRSTIWALKRSEFRPRLPCPNVPIPSDGTQEAAGVVERGPMPGGLIRVLLLRVVSP